MCKREDVICNCVFWRNFKRHLDKYKDWNNEMNIKEIRAIISRMYHLQKSDWNNAIRGAVKRKLIIYIGRDNLGCRYKVL